MRFSLAALGTLVLAGLVAAQTPTGNVTAPAPVPTNGVCKPEYDCSSSPKGCMNGGICQGKTCKCPPGFGDSDCSLLSCGSSLLDPTQRKTVPKGENCDGKCDAGFGGFNCNVCQDDNACMSKPVTRTSFLGNENLVCNKKPEVFYNGFMSCGVRTPELEALWPGSYSLSISMDAQNSSVTAQLWHGGDEQFWCSIRDCAKSTTESKENGIRTRWECPTMQCTCRPDAIMCGGVPGQVIILDNTINNLKGPFSLTCPHDDSRACDFFIGDLAGFFPDGLKMIDCDRGECVFPSEQTSQLTQVESTMAPGIIACFAVLGFVVLALIITCSLARRTQLRMMRTPYTLNTDAASVEFRNVGYTLNSSGLQILKGISGAAPAGVVLAVMGPSGAGKSTLVDILAGKRKDGVVTGQILLNGKQVHESDIRRAVGFVDQEDVLPPTQTVYEAILFSAMLRLPEGMPIHRVHERVSEVIEMLGLTHCAQRRIGNVTARGISGGEKRRVSIALELITRPPILILDEPTSGLDSFSAHMVVEVLSKLARSKTTTVILTIHQPRSDIFYMFDQTLVVAKGETLYFGPTKTAAAYFNRRGLECPPNYNIADYLLDIAMDQKMLEQAKSYGPDLEDEKAASTGLEALHTTEAVRRTGSIINGKAEVNVPIDDETQIAGGSSGSSRTSLSEMDTPGRKKPHAYATSFLGQLQVIMKRDFQTLIRNHALLSLHIAVSVVLGLFIGGLYFKVPMDLAGFQNRAGSLFFMLALLGFSSISALGAFTETRTLFIKERSNGYYPPMPFIISTLLFDLLPLRILPALLMGCISYWMIGLSPVVTTFFKFILILVLFNVATALFCLVIAAGVRSTGVASLASSIAMLFMMLFGGFMINQGKIPKALTWIQYLSIYKYGFEALAVNEVATSKLIDSIQGVSFNVPGSLILQKLFGFSLTGYWRNMVVLLGFILLFIGTFWGLVTLRLKERK
ncbi:hypothetical protein DFQ27_005006 [Actinomortierella ambigua]|uniref:ABC transporter domain-containing protein n=1 Tax=Actinomortierella ambigua TaxID=1343610 RepID=A0A9P6U3I0_9FUNG|nr:hypothetical protein DFQ27_005006 [Actinomortierella ambigua]